MNASQVATARIGNETRNQAPKKAPFVAKGHDAILKRIQDNPNSGLSILAASGEVYKGRLVARDKYTITIERIDDSGNLIRHTVYKQSIESFSEVRARNV